MEVSERPLGHKYRCVRDAWRRLNPGSSYTAFQAIYRERPYRSHPSYIEAKRVFDEDKHAIKIAKARYREAYLEKHRSIALKTR